MFSRYGPWDQKPLANLKFPETELVQIPQSNSIDEQDAMLKLARERHRRDVCNARLQDLEKELQMFSEEFGSRLHDLRVSMKDEIYTTPDLRPFSGSVSPDEEKSEGLEFHGQDIEKIH